MEDSLPSVLPTSPSAPVPSSLSSPSLGSPRKRACVGESSPSPQFTKGDKEKGLAPLSPSQFSSCLTAPKRERETTEREPADNFSKALMTEYFRVVSSCLRIGLSSEALIGQVKKAIGGLTNDTTVASRLRLSADLETLLGALVEALSKRDVLKHFDRPLWLGGLVDAFCASQEA